MDREPHATRQTPDAGPTLATRRGAGKRRHRGQSLAEFAILLPVFALIFLATLDLGRLFYASITLTNAAREAAFQASQTPSSYQAGQPCPTDAVVDTSNLVICRAILEAKNSFVEVSPAGVALTCDPAGCARAMGNTVSVTISGQFTLLTPMLAPFVGGQTLALSSTATAQLEVLPGPAPTPAPPPPVANFVADDTTPFVGQVVAFTDLSTNAPNDWLWNFGDGSALGTVQNPTHAYSSNGVYTVTLTATNAGGSDVEQKIGYITVTTPASPTPSPTASPTPACQNPPDIIGMTPGQAEAALNAAGFTNHQGYGDLTTGQKNKVQTQIPDKTQCVPTSTLLIYHYRPS